MQTKSSLPKCREDYHTRDKTKQCPNESKCVNCGEGHMVGGNNCEVEKGRVIKKMRADSRVRRRRAFQILAGEDESPRSNPHSYSTHFTCKIVQEKERAFNP